jgi:lipid-binding SYLF domain-containing protein
MKLSKLLFLSLILALSANTFAQKKSEIEKAQEKANSASEVMREIMRADDKAIPRDIMKNAQAVVVFPGVLKAAFFFGGQGGSGVVVRRLPDGTWSAPAFLNIKGGSVGPQIGGQKIDYVLVIRNESGLKGLLEDKFEMGGEASVAAGPVGRAAAATTNATLDAAILTYSRTQGLFAGVSLKGAVISPDKDLNLAIYQKSARGLLLDSPVKWSDAPGGLQEFPQIVANYAK